MTLFGWEGNRTPTAQWMAKSHLRADCLYARISSGPNARKRKHYLLPFQRLYLIHLLHMNDENRQHRLRHSIYIILLAYPLLYMLVIILVLSGCQTSVCSIFRLFALHSALAAYSDAALKIWYTFFREN